MARADNQPIMNNSYTIFQWDTGVPILDNYEYENEISYTMEQVVYDVHAEPDVGDYKDTGEYDFLYGNDNIVD